jgi:hypothetical protein
MEKYPIYRKVKKVEQFMKLNSNGILIKVNMVNGNNFNVAHTNNRIMIQDFHDPGLSVESNQDEFDSVFYHVQTLLKKANCE